MTTFTADIHAMRQRYSFLSLRYDMSQFLSLLWHVSSLLTRVSHSAFTSAMVMWKQSSISVLIHDNGLYCYHGYNGHLLYSYLLKSLNFYLCHVTEVLPPIWQRNMYKIIICFTIMWLQSQVPTIKCQRTVCMLLSWWMEAEITFVFVVCGSVVVTSGVNAVATAFNSKAHD